MILATLSGMPKFVSWSLTQDIFSTLSSSLVDATRPARLEAEEVFEEVGNHVEVAIEVVQ